MPDHTDEQDVKSGILRVLSHPALQGFIGLMGLVLALLALNPGGGGESPTPSPSSVNPPTPATPLAQVLRDLEVRSGPGVDFERLDVLPAESEYDILGISADRTWYQILLLDGRTGWILASERATRFEGSRAILRVLILTPSTTPSPTPSHTPTPTLSHTPTITPTETATPTPSITPSATITPSPTFTYTPSDAPTITPTSAVTSTPVQAYPCAARIVFTSGGLLNQVHVSPIANSPRRQGVQQGSAVQILAQQTNEGRMWLQISYDNASKMGWIISDYVKPGANCPR